MRKVPFLDLAAQQQALAAELNETVAGVFARGQFILGPEMQALEREVAAFCGTADAVAVANGTDALELALRACGIGPGDEVLTTAFSFFATAEAIAIVGARPIFVDIDPATYLLDPGRLEARVTPSTKAILPVHLYGHPCAMEQIMRVAKAHRLRVIEDCAQAIGAKCDGRVVGGFGDAGCLSFYPTKNLGGAGDSGMVLSSDAELARRLRLLRHHGDQGHYEHVLLGRNSRLDELQAAVLRVKLRSLGRWNEARRIHAAHYTKLLQPLTSRGLVLPIERPGAHHVYHLYTVRVPQRDLVRQRLSEAGVATQVYYPSIIPDQPAVRDLDVAGGRYPESQRAAREVLSLPMYPELSADDVDYVVDALGKALAKG